MRKRLPVVALAVGCALATAGCGSLADSPSLPEPGTVPVTEKQALAELDRVVAAHDAGPVKTFCGENVIEVETCGHLLDEARAECVRPGGRPKVLRSKGVPATKNTAGGWVLEVSGETAGGQPYVSHFLVSVDAEVEDGPARAAIGVYWTGLGFGDKAVSGWKNVLPKPECAKG
ncbi:hypothetical protein AB0M28_23485 [Streptomyces sp. NPDC051940]|uniref:hypothetical protein n=1 Tax=Streptomyces sp. NPDC051940 TaxID=3155675 RepID=UPI003428C26B